MKKLGRHQWPSFLIVVWSILATFIALTAPVDSVLYLEILLALVIFAGLAWLFFSAVDQVHRSKAAIALKVAVILLATVAAFACLDRFGVIAIKDVSYTFFVALFLLSIAFQVLKALTEKRRRGP